MCQPPAGLHRVPLCYKIKTTLYNRVGTELISLIILGATFLSLSIWRYRKTV